MSVVADDGDLLLIPDAQMREARLVTTERAISRDLDPIAAFAWADAALLPIPSEMYGHHEVEARARLQPGGQKDWPLVALALASGEAIWSNDVDLFGTGIVVWNTHNIGRAQSTPPAE